MYSLELDPKKQFKMQFRKRCFDFSLAILKISEELRIERKNWILIDQLVRSATSIGANVVEGSNSTSRREFINFFQIALKSASESVYWLELIKELNLQKETDLEKLIIECGELKRLLSTIILNTKNKL